MGTGYLDALDQLDKPAQAPAKKVSGYLEALDALDAPKNTKLQSDTQISQLDQPTGTFNDQKPSPKLSFLNSFESPQEAYVNEPARRVARAKENAGAIGPQKAFPSGKATLPSPLPSFIADKIPGMQVDVPESVNTFLGGLEGKASQLPVAPGRNLADVNRASDTQLLPLQNAAADVSDRLFGPSYPGAPVNLPLADKVGSGLVKGGANLISGFTSPKALATILAAKGLPAGTAQTGADLYFRKGMAETAANKTETGVTKLFGGDTEGGVADLTEALGSGYMAGAGLRREAEPAQEVKQGKLPVQGSPRLNFLQPMIENAPREGTNLENAAVAEELTGQQQLDQKRAAATQERMQQPAAMSYLDALDSVSPAKESLFKAGDEVPQNATPEQLSAISKAGFEIGQDGRLAEKPIPPSPRAGEEVPGLDQQADVLAKNAPQGDMSLRGEEKANIPTERSAALPGQEAQGIQPSQAEVHPNYEQIGIDADSGQPILKQKAERRLDTTERKRVSQMSPEEMQKELLTSESLNLPNKRAFLEEEARNPSPAISMSDADGLKAFNDKFGYEYGNKLLEAKAEALKEAGLDAYHEKGDEFLQRDGTPEDLQGKLEKARELLRNKEIKVTLDDGTIIKKYKGVDFSYGVGKDLSEAEANLKQHKAEREARGERARGELRGITEVGSEAGPVDRSSVQRVSTAKKTASLESGTTTQGVYGSETNVKTPSGSVPAKFKIVEADSLVPSHNAQSFAKNPQYPEGVQERAYHTSKEAQTRVIQQSQNYDPAYTVNTNPDAVNGPPVITPDGIVLGGNSRAMSTQRLYSRGGAEPYINEIKKQAAAFGVDPQSVDGFKRPVLVREVPKPATVEEARRLGSDLNRSMTGALGVSEKAVSAGKSITQSTLRSISGLLDEIGHSATMRDLFRERPREIVQLLVKDGVITDRERPQFVDTSTGGLSEDGKNFVERALIGSVVDDPVLLDRTPKSIINKLDSSLADIATLAGRTDEYNIMPLIREALSEHADIAQRGTDVDLHLQQSGMFGPERNEAVDAVIRKLADSGKSVRESMRSFTRDANADVQNQGFLGFGEPPAAYEAFNESFGTKFTERQYAENLVKTLESIAEKGTIEPGVDRGSNPSKTETPADRVQPSSGSEAPRSAEEGTGLNAPEANSKAAVDRAKAQAAKQRLNEKLGRSHSGVPVDAIPDLLEYGYYTFKAGARTFAEWSAKMLKDFGEQVRPHLKKAWDDIQEKIANGEEIAKPKALARGSAAVAEKPKPLAFLKAPETKQAGGSAPPKLPTFLKTAEPAPEGNFAGNINLDKLNTPEEIKAELKNVYRLNKDKIETQRRGVVSDASVEKAAREMGLTADDISKWKKGGARNAETIFAARHVMVGTAEALNAAKDRFLKSHSPVDLVNFQEAVAKHVAVQTSVAGATAEAGRALRQFRLISEAKKQFGRTNTEKVLDSIREAQGENWEAIATEVAKKLAQIPEGDTVALNKFLRNYAQFKTIDKIHAYWVSNVLSGPRTQSRNFISNQIFGLLQPVTRGVAAGVDAVSSKITGAERQTYAREIIPATMAYFGGIPDGLRRAAHIIQHGYDLMDAGKLEVPHGYEFPGGIKNPFNAPGRLLLAADAMSKTMHLQSELYALATRQAIKEGLSGNRLAERSFDLANNPTAEMVEQATKYSRWATFNDRPTGAIASIIQAREKIKPLKFIAPFINTPTNILKRGIEYSPAGLGRLFTEAGKKESSSVIARAAIGSMAMAGFAALAANGKLTGAAPSDADQRDAFYRAGKQPFSVKVGDRWVAYNQMGGPLSITMAAVAAFHDAFQQSGEVPTEKKIGQAAGVIGKSIVDASFFKGISDAIDAIREPERSADNLFSSISQGFVPFSGFLRNVAESQDEIIRDPQTMYERILTGIPGASKTVAPKIDPLGREVRREGGEGALAFLPSRIPKDQPKSGVDSELTRLGATLSKVGSQISVKNQKFELSKDQQRDLQKLTGNEINRVLAELFSRGNYKGLDDEKKALIVDKAIRAVREKARAEYLQKIHESDLKLKPKTRSLPYFLGQPAS